MRKCVAVSAVVLAGGLAAGQGGGGVQRDIRREENRQSSVAALTAKAAEDLRRVREEYQFNGLGQAGDIAILDEVASALDRLADPRSSAKLRNMPWVVAKLAAAREVESLLKRADELRSANGGQEWIIEELGKLIASVRAEFGEAAAGGLLRELIERQERLMEDTAKLAESTLGKSPQELTAEERAERDRLSEQQASLRQDVKGAAQEMREAAAQLAATDPAQAQALEQAASRLEQGQAAEAMQSASDNIRQNQMGAAQENQERALDALRDAQKMASSGSEQGPLAELDRQLAQMQDMIQRQENLLGETQGLDQGSSQQEYNNLQGEQTGLRGELQEMMGSQGQEQAQEQGGTQGQEQGQQHSAEQSLAKAEQAMGRASAALGQQNKDQAAGAMQEALENLRAARAEMAMALAQMQASSQQAMQQGNEPGREMAMQPGMPQQPQQGQKALETRQYQPNERRALYGQEKELQGQAAWQAELAAKEREVLTTSAREQFPEGYERLLQLYYRNLAATSPSAARE